MNKIMFHCLNGEQNSDSEIDDIVVVVEITTINPDHEENQIDRLVRQLENVSKNEFGYKYISDIAPNIIEGVIENSNFCIESILASFDKLENPDCNVDKWKPRISTLKEYFFHCVGISCLELVKKADYDVLLRVLKSDNDPIRLSSLIGARTTDQGRGDPMITLSINTQSQAISLSFIYKFLRRYRSLDIDYLEYFGNEDVRPIKGLPFDKLPCDNNGIRYCNYFPKNQYNKNTTSFNKLFALLSYLKFLTKIEKK